MGLNRKFTGLGEKITGLGSNFTGLGILNFYLYVGL